MTHIPHRRQHSADASFDRRRHDRTWGQFFETFEQFLAFSWPVVIVTDTRTGRAHIVTRMTSIAAFLKMIKTRYVLSLRSSRSSPSGVFPGVLILPSTLCPSACRFGETLPQADNLLRVTAFETSQRYLRHVNDWSTYKALHSTLPAVTLAAFKARVRVGDPKVIRELWATRDKTFLAIDFECLDRNDRSCVEWGYAAIRSGLLEAYVLRSS
jgi:hypothetical protein